MLLAAPKTGIPFVATFHILHAAPSHAIPAADTKLHAKPFERCS